ncbi:mitogen-activated protein kinase binding protein 1 [Balamuthia mandrillaris]
MATVTATSRPAQGRSSRRSTATARSKEDNEHKISLSLERVIGNTTHHNSGFACNPINNEIAYAAGCLVVLVDPKTNAQRFLTRSTNKPLTCLCYSSNGKYLAVGESGRQPAVVVWDLSPGPTNASLPKVVAELRGHKYGVACLAFSPDSKAIVSVGVQHDGFVHLWDWKTRKAVASNKITTKVYAVRFGEDGTYFVTCGYRHLKIWNIRSLKIDGGKRGQLEGRMAMLGTAKDTTFTDAGSRGGHIYAITTAGNIHLFNPSSRAMEKFVNLRTAAAFSISVSDRYIVCACTDGIVRIFDQTTLRSVATLPRPHALGNEVCSSISPSPSSGTKGITYPDVMSCEISSDNSRVTCVYSDRSVYVWDISNPNKVGKKEQCLPEGTFITCAADNTIRFWNLEDNVRTSSASSLMKSCSSSCAKEKNLYAKELLHIIHVSEDPSEIASVKKADLASYHKNNGDSNSIRAEGGVRRIELSPNGKYLASGDRLGNLREFVVKSVHELDNFEQVFFKEAHDAEILALQFFGNPTEEKSSSLEAEHRDVDRIGPFLASAGRDRLIHLLDTSSNDYPLLHTLDDHSSSITSLVFAVCQPALASAPLTEREEAGFDQEQSQQFQLYLISGSADKSLIFRTVKQVPASGATTSETSFTADDAKSLLEVVRYHTASHGHGTIYDMDIHPSQRYVLASQDKRLRVFDVATGKHQRVFSFGLNYFTSSSTTSSSSSTSDNTPASTTAAQVNQDFIKAVVDPSGTFVAASCSDKHIRLFEWASGRCVADLPSGHSEVLTGIKFLPLSNGQLRLVTVSGDGCIFVWRLGVFYSPSLQQRPASATTATSHRQPVGQSAPTAGEEQPVVRFADDHLPTQPSLAPTQSTSNRVTHEAADAASSLPLHSPSSSALAPWLNGEDKAEISITNDPLPLAPPVNKQGPVRGKWAQRIGQSGFTLFSDVGKEENLVVNPFQIDTRRFTIEPSSAASLLLSSKGEEGIEGVDDDDEEEDVSTTLSKSTEDTIYYFENAESTTMISDDECDIKETVIEEIQQQADDEDEPEEEPSFLDNSHNNSSTDLTASTAATSEEAFEESLHNRFLKDHFDFTSTPEEEGQPNNTEGQEEESYVSITKGEETPPSPSHPGRLSLSSKFLFANRRTTASKKMAPSPTEHALRLAASSLPTSDKPVQMNRQEKMAEEVAKARQKLATMGLIASPPSSSASSSPLSAPTQSSSVGDSSPFSTPTTSSATSSLRAEDMGDEVEREEEERGNDRIDEQKNGLHHSLQTYEQALNNLEQLFDISLELYQELGQRMSSKGEGREEAENEHENDKEEHATAVLLHRNFSNLFANMQQRLEDIDINNNNHRKKRLRHHQHNHRGRRNQEDDEDEDEQSVVARRHERLLENYSELLVQLVTSKLSEQQQQTPPKSQ